MRSSVRCVSLRLRRRPRSTLASSRVTVPRPRSAGSRQPPATSLSSASQPSAEWLEPVFSQNPALELSNDVFRLHETARPIQRYGLRPGYTAAGVKIDNLFYA